MMGFGVVTPYHCWNGFFMRSQFTAIFPKHIFNATLDLAKDYIKTASNLAHAAEALEEQTTGLRQSHQPLQSANDGRLPDHFVQRAGLIGTRQSHGMVSCEVQYE